MPTEAARMSVRFVRDRATWIVYLLSVYYAYGLNIMGPMTPFLRSELSLTYTLASLHFSAFAVGLLLSGILADRVVARLGRQTTLWAGAFGICCGATLLAAGRQPSVTITACFVMGLLGGWILAAYPTVLVSLHGRLAAIAFTEATILTSIAAVAAPFCLGLLARSAAGWRAALLLPILTFVPFYLVLRSERLGRPSEGTAPKHSAGNQKQSLPGTFWIFWLMLVTVVAIQFCIAFWIADFLHSERGLARADAALATTFFTGALFVGRAAGSRLLRQVPPKDLVLTSLGVTGLGFLLFWQMRAIAMVDSGLILAGLGVANLYPSTLALSLGTAPEQLDLASARASLASGISIISLPLLLGRIADRVGITPAFALVGVLTVLAAALLLVGGAQQSQTAGAAVRETQRP